MSPPQTTIEELGLSSLERVELMVALEDAFQTRIDEGAFAEARTIGAAAHARRARVDEQARAGRAGGLPALEPIVAGARDPPARACRPGFCRSPALFAWIRVEGRNISTGIDGPVHLRRRTIRATWTRP